MTAMDAAIAATVFCAAFAQGVIGFGFGLLLMAILPRLLALQTSVVTVALLGACVCLLMLWRYRRAVRWPIVARLCAGGLLGLPLGVLVLRDVDPDPCIRVLGAVLAAYAAWSLRRPAPPAPDGDGGAGWEPPVGFLGGVLGGAFGTGGPPIVVYANLRAWPPGQFRGIAQGFFTVTNVVHIVLLSTAGLVTRPAVERAVWLVPLVPVGVWLGARYGDRLHPGQFRKVVLVALLAMGAHYLWTGA